MSVRTQGSGLKLDCLHIVQIGLTFVTMWQNLCKHRNWTVWQSGQLSDLWLVNKFIFNVSKLYCLQSFHKILLNLLIINIILYNNITGFSKICNIILFMEVSRSQVESITTPLYWANCKNCAHNCHKLKVCSNWLTTF